MGVYNPHNLRIIYRYCSIALAPLSVINMASLLLMRLYGRKTKITASVVVTVFFAGTFLMKQ
jgi:hypothetical protein